MPSASSADLDVLNDERKCEIQLPFICQIVSLLVFPDKAGTDQALVRFVGFTSAASLGVWASKVVVKCVRKIACASRTSNFHDF